MTDIAKTMKDLKQVEFVSNSVIFITDINPLKPSVIRWLDFECSVP